MADNATIQIPKDLLEPAIKAQVSKALIEAMSLKTDLLGALAERILLQKVDSENGKPTDSSYRAVTWVQWLTDTMTKEAIKEAILAQGAEFKANVRAAVEKELKKPNSKLVKEMSEGAAFAVMESASKGWNLSVNISRRKDD